MHPQVSRNYRLAISKALRETLEYLDTGNVNDPAAFDMLDELVSDDQDKPVRPTGFIEEQLEKYRAKRAEMLGNMKRNAIEYLTGKGHVKDEL